MTEHKFAQSDDARRMCARIKEALMTFGGKDKNEAARLLEAYFTRLENIDDDPLFYREPPYYYAMCILHHPVIGDNNVWWHTDPTLWPPPAEWWLE